MGVVNENGAMVAGHSHESDAGCVAVLEEAIRALTLSAGLKPFAVLAANAGVSMRAAPAAGLLGWTLGREIRPTGFDDPLAPPGTEVGFEMVR